MDLENTTRRRENGVAMESYFHIWMSPGHFHVVLDVASCYLNLSFVFHGTVDLLETRHYCFLNHKMENEIIFHMKFAIT